MTVSKDRIVLRPVFKKAKRVRAGWSQAFADMAKAGDDHLLLDAAIDSDFKDWKW